MRASGGRSTTAAPALLAQVPHPGASYASEPYSSWLPQLKSVSARNEYNYVAYTVHLAALSLQTHGQAHQARLNFLAVAQFRCFGKDLKHGCRGFSG